MARSPSKRQKQLERKKAKRRQKKTALARQESRGLAAQLEQAARAPVLHAEIAEETWDMGIGQVLLSRKLPDGRIAAATFVVDIYCLGVKDAFARIVTPEHYSEVREQMAESVTMTRAEPACVRKLVEASVEYANDLGLAPHPDYRKVCPIFGDIDPSDCPHEYTFGEDGKPLFVAGPHDSPARCRRIMNTLRDRLGPEGFNYMVPLFDEGPDEWPPLLEDDFDEDGDTEDAPL